MLQWQRPAWHSAMPLSFAGVLELPAIDGVCLQHTRFALPSRHAEGEVEGGEAAAESSKPKRGKAAKERKAKAAAAGGLQGEACHVLFGLDQLPFAHDWMPIRRGAFRSTRQRKAGRHAWTALM